MSKFVQVEVSCEIQYGSGETKWESEMIMLNTAHIVRFTTYGNMIWLSDGQRYSATQRGINHLMGAVDKYGVDDTVTTAASPDSDTNTEPVENATPKPTNTLSRDAHKEQGGKDNE